MELTGKTSTSSLRLAKSKYSDIFISEESLVDMRDWEVNKNGDSFPGTYLEIKPGDFVIANNEESIAKYLGVEMYQPIIDNIYAGLAIPKLASPAESGEEHSA